MKDIRKNNVTAGANAARRLAVKILLFTLPLWATVLLYLYDDPFMVLRPYRVYDSDVVLNEQHVGWAIYRNNRDSVRFNSFILGNSCTMAFPCGEWEKFLDKGDRAIRLFGNAESMKAILLKLQALEREGAELKNVLMVLDRSSLWNTQLLRGFSNLLPAEVSGNSPFSVQLELFQGFTLPEVLFPYLLYRLTGNVPPANRNLNPYGRIRNPVNNDALNPRDRMIAEEGESYWQNRPHEFPVRDGHALRYDPAISQPQQALLNEIASLLRRHRTSARIVISPDYNQKQLHPADKKKLERIFGKQNVFDFSGANEYTADYHNYYEEAHYRPQLGVKLLEKVYGK